MKKLNLKSSMTDRIEIDDLAYLNGQETAQKIERDIPFDIEGCAEATFGELGDVYEIDDITEAEARWEREFARGFKQQILDQLADELENVEYHVRVFDTGQEVFGDFESGKDAAKAVRNSNPEWWAMSEYPTFEPISE